MDPAFWTKKTTHPRLTVQQQCELLGVPRSTYYYQPRPESAENLRRIRQLDELYLKCPFFGSRKMAVELEINRKQAQRLMRILGIEAHYAKPNLSRPVPGHEIYPYLLRGRVRLNWNKIVLMDAKGNHKRHSHTTSHAYALGQDDRNSGHLPC